MLKCYSSWVALSSYNSI